MTHPQTLDDVSVPKRLRQMRDTEREILEAIRRRPGQSRAELAQRLDYSRALLTQSVSSFLEEGWITEKREHVPSRRGQPSLRLKVRERAIAGLGLSLSTGGIRGAVVDLGGKILQTAENGINAQDLQVGSAAAVSIIRDLLSHADCFAGITIWAPAMISESGEIEEVTPTQSGVDFSGYKKILEDEFGLPVLLESKCPSIDEAMFGSDPEDLVFMLFLDYGIGGSLIDGLRVFRGGFGQAVNIGALVPDTGLRPSLPDLAKYFDLPGSEPGTEFLETLLSNRDQRLLDWIQSRGEVLSDPMSIVVQFFNPTDVVLSGMYPREILEGLADQIDFSRYDVPGRLPIKKPRLRIARNVGPGSLAATAGSTSLFRVLAAKN
ncbi:MAG: ROK family transcriptional regulator [Pseudomonadota bacterium]